MEALTREGKGITSQTPFPFSKRQQGPQTNRREEGEGEARKRGRKGVPSPLLLSELEKAILRRALQGNATGQDLTGSEIPSCPFLPPFFFSLGWA